MPPTQHSLAPTEPSSTHSYTHANSNAGPQPQQPKPRRPRSLLHRLRPLSPIIFILTLTPLFYMYSRTTVSAAKENARRAREADGGSISWRREGLRRRGVVEKVEEKGLWDDVKEKLGRVFGGGLGEGEDGAAGDESADAAGRRREMEARRRREQQRLKEADRNPIEEGIRRARDENRRKQAEDEEKARREGLRGSDV